MSIKNFIDDTRDFLFRNILSEESNLTPATTGLSHTVHVTSRGGAKHGPRVKVSNVPGTFSKDDNFSISVEHEPRVIGNCKLKKEHLNTIIDWVKLNHDHLHAVWDSPDIMQISQIRAGFKHFK